MSRILNKFNTLKKLKIVIYNSSSSLVLQPCVGLGQPHGFLTVNFFRMGLLAPFQTPTRRIRGYNSSGP
jgi:hypothetical protein